MEEDGNVLDKVLRTIASAKLISGQNNFILLPDTIIPVKLSVLDENTVKNYLYNLYQSSLPTSQYGVNKIWAGAYDFNLQPLTMGEIYQRFKDYYKKPLQNVENVQYTYYKNIPFKVTLYNDNYYNSFTSSLVNGKIIWNTQYVDSYRVLTGYEASIKKTYDKYNHYEGLYYAFKDHDCPVFLAVVDSKGRVVKEYAPALPRLNAVAVAGNSVYNVHLPHSNDMDHILESIGTKNNKPNAYKSLAEIFRIQVLLRKQSDIAVNPLEHVAYMIKKKENRKADFNILKIDKGEVREWRYKADLYYVNKNKSVMYALNIDETNNLITLVTHSKGKVRRFKINAENLLNQADDIIGFKPLVLRNNLNVKMYYIDKKDTKVHTVTYRTKDEQLKHNYPVEGFYTEQVEQDLLAEKDGFQVYAVRNWGYSYFSEYTKQIPPISYLIIDNNTRKWVIKSKLIRKTLKDIEKINFSEEKMKSTLFNMSSRVYIGQKNFYVYEENVAEKHSSNVVTIYNRTTKEAVEIIERGIAVVPNQGLPLSRYIYTFKSMLKENSTEFTVIDSETLEKKRYRLPGFKVMFDSRNSNIRLTPYLLRNIHVKIDKDSNIIIYRQTNKNVSYEAVSGVNSKGDYTGFYVPNYQVYYIITKDKVYSFGDKTSKNNHLVLTDLNILSDGLYLQKQERILEVEER